MPQKDKEQRKDYNHFTHIRRTQDKEAAEKEKKAKNATAAKKCRDRKKARNTTFRTMVEQQVSCNMALYSHREDRQSDNSTTQTYG